MSIHDFIHKIKGYTDKAPLSFMYISITVIIGFSSFLLGRLSVSGLENSADLEASAYDSSIFRGIGSVYSSQATSSQVKINTTPMISGSGNYVASKNGKLYYTASCKGANRIKEENRVWFDTVRDAEKSGYTRAPSCK